MPSRVPVRPATAAGTLPATPAGWWATAWCCEADNNFSKRAANPEALEIKYKVYNQRMNKQKASATGKASRTGTLAKSCL